MFNEKLGEKLLNIFCIVACCILFVIIPSYFFVYKKPQNQIYFDYDCSGVHKEILEYMDKCDPKYERCSYNAKTMFCILKKTETN